MNQQEATDFLVELFPASTPSGYIERALIAYRVVDSEGRPPVHPDYVETFDQWLAAARVAELMEINGSIATVAEGSGPLLSFNSEGATYQFGKSGETWGSIAARLRSMSTFYTDEPTEIGWIFVETGIDTQTPRSAWSE